MLFWNVVLALAWMALNGEYSPGSFLTGFVLGFLVLGLLSLRGIVDSPLYSRRVWMVFSFAGFFVYELVLANLRMVAEVFKPHSQLKSAIIAVPLQVRNEGQIALLANLVTLTPGTMSLDVSPDRDTLYVHVLNLAGRQPEDVAQEIKTGFERRVLMLFGEDM